MVVLYQYIPNLKSLRCSIAFDVGAHCFLMSSVQALDHLAFQTVKRGVAHVLPLAVARTVTVFVTVARGSEILMDLASRVFSTISLAVCWHSP